MPARKDPDASASVPSFYGAELRYKREAAGLTLEQLIEGSYRGISFLSQIERGERRMPVDLARHVDLRLDTDGFFERRCDDVAKARQKGYPLYFADVPDLERQATVLEEWGPLAIPGLLQTGEYFRGSIQYSVPTTSPDRVEELVSARLARAELWQRVERPRYWGILRESTLRNTPLPPSVMAGQLEHILNVIRSTQSILQVVPETTPWHPLKHGMAKIMTFADAPPLVWTESEFEGRIVDFPATVEEYRRRYDLLRAVALPPDASLSLIEAAARTYRNEAEQSEHPTSRRLAQEQSQ
ncbi:helix-turn-helix domain-containing protein [Streptomyces sp. SHP 1-2]|uniref:helix-turn-helix domain-containing protein n=1 Tax=Streptomyces sp. SHP 1-2 TaxID=2769489 RepID=UPI00223802A0|nr:helix-turn-helix transcriptional regulator [Streptomyces sp. SHP 1-2]MCW5251586.1 helix-turn-helix transcriptional regulator [Streptomyces sp. SHP 1-2]